MTPPKYCSRSLVSQIGVPGTQVLLLPLHRSCWRRRSEARQSWAKRGMDRCRIPLVCGGRRCLSHQVCDNCSPNSPSLDNSVLLVCIKHWIGMAELKVMTSNELCSTWKLPSPLSHLPTFQMDDLGEIRGFLFHSGIRSWSSAK